MRIDKNPRIVFMGTPDFAVPSLRALHQAGYRIVGVFAQPDRPVGRGHKLAVGEVKKAALEYGLPVFQFEKIRRPEGVEALLGLAPDLVVTAAFGQILSQKILDIPRFGTVNVHASLLPKYRGAAPINWAIIKGEGRTGVTTMLTDAGVDTGDMLLCRETPIGENETAGELGRRLSEMGAELLIETLKAMQEGTCPRTPQDPGQATHLPMLNRGHGCVDFAMPAQEIHNLVRGVTPWPGAYTHMPEGVLKIWKTRVLNEKTLLEPGTVLCADNRQGLRIATGDGLLEVIEMQAPGARRMDSRAYLCGKTIPVGACMLREAEHG